jgi:hypothetical protein
VEHARNNKAPLCHVHEHEAMNDVLRKLTFAERNKQVMTRARGDYKQKLLHGSSSFFIPFLIPPLSSALFSLSAAFSNAYTILQSVEWKSDFEISTEAICIEKVTAF